MEQYYSDERNVQILVSLLKQHGIRYIVASPGSTNVTFVGSIQQDSFFTIFSCVDERSAAYMACGIAAETNEPVALSCTGATASRNYYPALTEAFYRKLPILAITSTQDLCRLGHLNPQVIDRSQQPNDTVKMSVHLQNVKDADDEWDCMIKVNKAILELDHHGKGPVHINLSTRYSKDFSVKELPAARKIERLSHNSTFPEISCGKIAIFVGSHCRWGSQEQAIVEKFCEVYNAVVFADSSSNYKGKYAIPYSLFVSQKIPKPNLPVDLLIHIGNMSDLAYMVGSPREVWRVSEDGELCDRFRRLTYVFEMEEHIFFEHYTKGRTECDTSYYSACRDECKRIWEKIPELPFSQLWISSNLFDKLPLHSTIHLGILSPLRSWSYFDIDKSIEIYCNQGGFGIDGNLSSMIGASFVASDKLFYGIVGDLSFFYDMNSLGNRHIGPNVRILLINNAMGAEFHLFRQINLTYVNNIGECISAAGHFGKKSHDLVRHLAEDLGFEYIAASTKDEFLESCGKFLCKDIGSHPMLFEVFTDVEDENQALWDMWHIETEPDRDNRAKRALRSVLGEKGTMILKKAIGRK